MKRTISSLFSTGRKDELPDAIANNSQEQGQKSHIIKSGQKSHSNRPIRRANTEPIVGKVTSPRSRYNNKTPQILVVAEKSYILEQQALLKEKISAITLGPDKLSLLHLDIKKMFFDAVAKTKICSLGDSLELLNLAKHYKVDKEIDNKLTCIQYVFKEVLAECIEPAELIELDKEIIKKSVVDALVIRLSQLKKAISEIPLYNCNAINKEIDTFIASYRAFVFKLEKVSLEEKKQLLLPKVRVDGPEIGACFMAAKKVEKILGLSHKMIPGRNRVVFYKGLYWKSEIPTYGCGTLDPLEPWMEYDFSIFLRFLFGKLKHPVAAPTTFIHLNLQRKLQQSQASNAASQLVEQTGSHIIQVGLGIGQFDLEEILSIMQYVHYLVDKVGEKNTCDILKSCVEFLLKQSSVPAEKRNFDKERDKVLNGFKNFIQHEEKKQDKVNGLATIINSMKSYIEHPHKLDEIVEKKGAEELFLVLTLIKKHPEIAKDRVFEELCNIPKYLCLLQSVLPELDSDLVRIRDVLLWHEKFDYRSYCILVLLMMLLSAGDCHEKNIRIIIEKNTDGLIQKFYFCSIDNDKVFVEPIGGSPGHHYLLVKCILYCMDDLMNKPIDKHVRAIFLQTMPEKFLHKWFSLLHQRECQCEEVANRIHALNKNSSLPNGFFHQTFKGRDITKLYLRYFKMHEHIKETPGTTLQALLNHLDPIVADVYSYPFDDLLNLTNQDVRLLTRKCSSLDRLFLLFKMSIEEMYGIETSEKTLKRKDSKKTKSKLTPDQAQMLTLLDAHDTAINKLSPRDKELSVVDLANNFDIPSNTFVNKRYVTRGLAPGGTGLFLSSNSPIQRIRRAQTARDTKSEVKMGRQ